MKKPARFSLGIRLSLVQAAVVLVVMGIFTFTLTSLISRKLEQRTEKDLTQQITLLISSMSAYHSSLADSADKVMAVFRTYFPGSIIVDPSKTVAIGDKQVPLLRAGSATLNLDTGIVDRFSGITKAVGTVFVRSGDDFIRISTSLKKEDGSRAVGTALDRLHPAYPGILRGEEFVGKASLFGKDFITKYLPIKDDSGKVVAVLFIGFDFSDSLKALKEKIRSVKIGQAGYFYAIDANQGKDFGKTQLHPVPASEGTSSLEAKAADGREFIKEMLKQKNGIIHYPWINKEANESSPREKLVAFQHFKE